MDEEGRQVTFPRRLLLLVLQLSELLSSSASNNIMDKAVELLVNKFIHENSAGYIAVNAMLRERIAGDVDDDEAQDV